jgi:hypothetical protein
VVAAVGAAPAHCQPHGGAAHRLAAAGRRVAAAGGAHAAGGGWRRSGGGAESRSDAARGGALARGGLSRSGGRWLGWTAVFLLRSNPDATRAMRRACSMAAREMERRVAGEGPPRQRRRACWTHPAICCAGRGGAVYAALSSFCSH